MRLTIKYLLLFSIVFNLYSCQPSTQFKSTPINNNYANHSQVDSLIQPYKTALDAQMNEVLVISAEEFPRERGKSETKLGNLVADLSLEIANDLYKPSDNDSIDFCLLNFGGLRTSLPKGEITRGKIFELMPFENELVIVTITKFEYGSLTDYLYLSGGQPISGKKLLLKPGTIENSNKGDIFKEALFPDSNEYVKVLTTDYLANGGDQMNFFLNPIKIEPLGIKLRDAIIQFCIEQHKNGNQLAGKLDGRITFE